MVFENGLAYVLFGSSISRTWHTALCYVVDLLQDVSQVCSRDLHDFERAPKGSCRSAYCKGFAHASSSLSKDIILCFELLAGLGNRA